MPRRRSCGQHRRGGLVGLDEAVGDVHDASCVRRDVGLVRDHHDRSPGEIAPPEDLHQLAPRRADGRDELAALDADVDTAQRLHGDVAGRIGLRDPLEDEGRATPHPPKPPGMTTLALPPPSRPWPNVALLFVLLFADESLTDGRTTGWFASSP